MKVAKSHVHTYPHTKLYAGTYVCGNTGKNAPKEG